MKNLFKNSLLARLAFIALVGFAAALGGNVLHKASAANVSLFPTTPPLDPSMAQLNLNTLVNAINNGVAGVKNSQFVASGNGADTTEDTLYTYSIPAGLLATNGQALRITCFGTSTNNTDVKTVKLYFGSVAYSVSISTSTANVWKAELTVIRTGASAAQVMQIAWQGANVIAPAFTADSSDNLANAVVTKCTGQASVANANDITGQGFIVEILQ